MVFWTLLIVRIRSSSGRRSSIAIRSFLYRSRIRQRKTVLFRKILPGRRPILLGRKPGSKETVWNWRYPTSRVLYHRSGRNFPKKPKPNSIRRQSRKSRPSKWIVLRSGRRQWSRWGMFSSGYVQLGLSGYCGRSYVNDDIRLRLPCQCFCLGFYFGTRRRYLCQYDSNIKYLCSWEWLLQLNYLDLWVGKI